MKRLINIYGKGGHARVVKNAIYAKQRDLTVQWYNDDDYLEYFHGPWVIAIGNNKVRQKISIKLKEKDFTTVIHPTALWIKCLSLGEGSQIMMGAVIQNDVTIGNHTIINTAASIDHDSRIGSYVHIAPNSTLCGGVEIGDGTLIGAGSVILPYVKIGKNCIIGAGSVVTKNIPDDCKAWGNPCEIKKPDWL